MKHRVLKQAVRQAQPGWLGAWALCAAVVAQRAASVQEALLLIDPLLITPQTLSLCPRYQPLAEALAQDPGLLGDAYAAAAAPAANQKKGRFYTPQAVVNAVLPPRFKRGEVVLDPACGGGRFLLGALARHPDGVKSLWGVDLDPMAAAICRTALWLASGGQAKVQVGDPLAGHAGQGPLRLEAHCADQVVGNPPYRAARRGQSLTGDARAYRQAFVTAEYQLDPYVLFLELGLHALRPGGVLRMIVPNAWASNLRAGRLRRHLAEIHGLRRIIELPPDSFNAGVETVAIEVHHSGTTPAQIPVQSLTGEPAGSLLYDAQHPAAPLPLARTPQILALLQRSRRWIHTLGELAEITRGINPYHHSTHTPEQIAARVHHREQPPDAPQGGPQEEGWRAELCGRDLVGPYRLWPRGRRFIHYGPWLKEPRQPRFFEGPRILVRKVLGETLFGAYLDAPMLCDQSLYIARLKPQQPWPPAALLACVNSALIATLLRARHQEHDQLFPQLKIYELRGLPLPPVSPDAPEVAALAQAVGALQTLERHHAETLKEATDDPKIRRRLLKAGWPMAPAARTELAQQRAAIEEAVWALYGVSELLEDR